MTEAENHDVVEEVVNPEAEAMGSSHAEAVNSEVQEQKRESDAEMNFRKLRESNEKLQREREQDRQMMHALQEELLKRNEQKQVKEPEADEFADVDPSDWTTYEQTQKLAERIADARVQKAIQDYENKRKNADMPNRVRSKFQDLDAVVTKENVEKLRALEPEIAHALSLIGDEESQIVAAYKYIKSFVPIAEETKAVQQRIESNANRPKSLSSAGSASPLSKAIDFESGMTADLKKQLYAEAMECARRG